jgi:hypothetical protein
MPRPPAGAFFLAVAEAADATPDPSQTLAGKTASAVPRATAETGTSTVVTFIDRTGRARPVSMRLGFEGRSCSYPL